MNDYTETRLTRIREALFYHLKSIDLIHDSEAGALESAHEMSLLLDEFSNGSHFKQDCKEVESELYRLADKEGLIRE